MNRLLILITLAFCFSFDPAEARHDEHNRSDSRRGCDIAGRTYKEIARWLVENGYYTDMRQAGKFARTGYEGYGKRFSRPYYWDIDDPVQVEVISLDRRYRGELGYYTVGADCRKSLTEIFNGRLNGLRILDVNEPFGFYLADSGGKTYFTGSSHSCFWTRNDASRALIYELDPGQEWLIAWENTDLSKWHCDRNNDDLYVRVTTVPEPLSLGLMIAGWPMLYAAKRRIRQKQKRAPAVKQS